jgi:hypothetical protein
MVFLKLPLLLLSLVLLLILQTKLSLLLLSLILLLTCKVLSLVANSEVVLWDCHCFQRISVFPVNFEPVQKVMLYMETGVSRPVGGVCGALKR